MGGIGGSRPAKVLGDDFARDDADDWQVSGGKLLRQVKLFDIYRGKGVAEGKKSVAFSLTLRADDRTLTDADSDGVISAVLSRLENELGAKLR